MLAVLDTNVIASGILWFDARPSSPALVLHAWLAGRFAVATSAPLLAEAQRTLDAPYFEARIARSTAAEWMDAIRVLAHDTAITIDVAGVATHPEDDLVLATAASARADYLVTGDRQLLRLGSFEGVSILSPADFLIVLDREGREPGEPIVP